MGHRAISEADFKKAVANLKSQVKIVNDVLKGRNFLVGDKVSVADVVVSFSLMIAFQTVLDSGYRKAMGNVSAWFERCMALPSFTKIIGSVRMCDKALKPWDGKTVAAAPAKKVEEDDDMDLFGDDNEEDAKAAEEAKAKMLAAKAPKKEKKKVIAQSLVMFEVKPLDDQTNLDDLAKRILKELAMDGAFWKSEYKKEPVAFGIYKLIVAVTIEDDKVSVDNDLVEKIELMEDMVQSVEILAFNKI